MRCPYALDGGDYPCNLGCTANEDSGWCCPYKSERYYFSG